MTPYNVNSGAAYGNFLGYEKIRLGWITLSEIQVINSNTSPVNLPDMEMTTSGTKILKIPLDANQSIFVENRSWNSIYEARYVPNNFQKPLKPGVLAYLITYEDDYLNNTPIQQICADGKWTWNIIAGGGTGSVADNDDVIVKAIPNSITGYDEREDIHIAGQGTKTWWALYYPNAYLYGSNYGRWYAGTNYIDENHDVRDYGGDVNKLFDVGCVISPWSNGATHKWNEATGSFAATTIGIEVTGYNSSNSSYTLSVRTSNPDQLSPSKPQNLQATTTPDNEPILTWTANTEPDIANYEVWRNINTLGGPPGTFSKIATVPSNTYTDYGLSVGSGPWKVYYKIRAVDSTSKVSSFSDMLILSSGGFFKREGGKGREGELPAAYVLSQNYPNPFNPSTTISYGVPEDAYITLTVYDRLGRVVQRIVDASKEAGYYSVQFDAPNVAGGVYFCRMQAGKYSAVKKMIVMK